MKPEIIKQQGAIRALFCYLPGALNPKETRLSPAVLFRGGAKRMSSKKFAYFLKTIFRFEIASGIKC
jgi:hypothetical protein